MIVKLVKNLLKPLQVSVRIFSNFYTVRNNIKICWTEDSGCEGKFHIADGGLREKRVFWSNEDKTYNS